MENLDPPLPPKSRMGKWRVFALRAASSLIWGGWGFAVPFYFVQDCSSKQSTAQCPPWRRACFLYRLTADCNLSAAFLFHRAVHPPPPPTFSTNVVRDVEKHAGSGAVSGLSDHETIRMHQYLKSYDVPSRKLNSSKLPAFPCAGYCTWTTLRIEKGATSLRTAWHDWYYQALRNFPASQSPKQKGRRTAWS